MITKILLRILEFYFFRIYVLGYSTSHHVRKTIKEVTRVVYLVVGSVLTFAILTFFIFIQYVNLDGWIVTTVLSVLLVAILTFTIYVYFAFYRPIPTICSPLDD